MQLDRLLVNGTIYTLKSEGDTVEAVGIKDGRIVFTGSAAEAREFTADEVIDLSGQTVIPGMGDSHMHFYAFCQTLTNVDLGPCTSKAEMLDRLRAAAEKTPEGQWIRGSNFDQSKWEDCDKDALPDRHDLDAASSKHPIVIKRVCLHTAVANTAALERAGIGRDYQAGPGGVVEREPDGFPNGILREQLTRIFDEIIPDPMNDPSLKKHVMVQQLRDMASLGMTMMHTYAADIWKYFEDVADYDALNREGLLPLRVTVYLDKIEKLVGKPAPTAAQRADPAFKAKLGGYKLFCDGSLGSRSAALYEPYDDDPGNTGIVVEDLPALERKMLYAMENGIQCATHAIGDRGLDIVVTAIEHTVATLRAQGWSDARLAEKPFRIIHAQMATPELIDRMAKLPVILDIQPAFYLTDMHWIKDRVGEERVKTGFLWRTYQEHNLLMTGGSDAPVEKYDPMQGIYAAVTRQDLKGWPAGGLLPEQRLSVYDALCLFSKNIPYATGDADYMGTIEVGKFADMAVLDRDIFRIPHEDLLHVKVTRTMLAGRDTWIRA